MLPKSFQTYRRSSPLLRNYPHSKENDRLLNRRDDAKKPRTKHYWRPSSKTSNRMKVVAMTTSMASLDSDSLPLALEVPAWALEDRLAGMERLPEAGLAL